MEGRGGGMIYIIRVIIICLLSSFRMLIGGKVRVMLTGGAPLAPETHDYIRYIIFVLMMPDIILKEKKNACNISFYILYI